MILADPHSTFVVNVMDLAQKEKVRGNTVKKVEGVVKVKARLRLRETVKVGTGRKEAKVVTKVEACVAQVGTPAEAA